MGSHALTAKMTDKLPNKRPPASQVEAWLQGATLLEEDGFGPKVYALADGERMLKLFRRKRWLSSNLWNPYARRFATNSLRLKTLGIPTMTVIEWGRLRHLQRQYVLYEKLPGRTLRESTEWSPRRLGAFLAELHERGVYFRSCHLGNILLLENGDFGLIDIMDMRFFDKPLDSRSRLRNFHHLTRVQRDRERLEKPWPTFIEGYEEASRQTLDGRYRNFLAQSE